MSCPPSSSERADHWRFCLITFGCKVNQYETQALREAWRQAGGEECDDPGKADLLLINSCAVTANAVADARQAVHRLTRLAPHARLVVAGCAAGAARDAFLSLPGVAALIPPRRKGDLLNAALVRDILRGDPPRPPAQPEAPPSSISASRPLAQPEAPPFASPLPVQPENAYPPFTISAFRRARPVLKVQDGCSHGCAYCIVPSLRGPSRSRPAADCLAEARRLLEAGHREIMLSGIDLGQYRDIERRDFWDLLRFLDRSLAPEWEGRARLRLSSVDPARLDARALDCLLEARLVCPHLHLSLQSGSPAVLRAMRRAPLDADRLLDALRQLTAAHGGRFGLGADLLTGFPGEGETEAAETLALAQALPLTYAHVFPFSSRPGTPAADLPHQVPPVVRRERATALRTVAEAGGRAFREASLAQPRLMVAPDGNGSLNAVDACYLACRLASPPPPEAGHSLLPARPAGIEKNCVVVELIN